MSRSPPLRFLVLLLAGWTGIRAAWLVPGWWTAPAGAGGRTQDAGAPPIAAAPRRAASAPLRPRPARGVPAPSGLRPGVAAASVFPARAGLQPTPPPTERARPFAMPAATTFQSPSPSLPGISGAAPATAPRWSFSAWSFVREGDSAALAAGGLLGGSQAGARLTYRLNGDRARPLAVAARLASPLRRPAGAEAALGLDWRPSRRVPLHLLGERRQRLGREGRSAFALALHGGVSDAPWGRLRIDAYAQAGIVGARSRDRFGDGALRLSLPLGQRAGLGAGLWAAAQPGLARLDFGPQASLRLPLAGRTLTVAADWRQRLAGNARPASGPTLTLSTDF